MPHARRKRNWNKQYYGKNRDEILAQKKEAYSKDPEAKRGASKEVYDNNPARRQVIYLNTGTSRRRQVGTAQEKRCQRNLTRDK